MAFINKITVGYVIQVWDTEQEKFVSQEFIAGDDVTYEDDNDGESIEWSDENPLFNEYLPFDMIQPYVKPQEPEPPIGEAAGMKLRWIKWYRTHKGASLKEAVEQYNLRQDEQFRADHGVVS